MPLRRVCLGLLLAAGACAPRVAPPEAPIVDPGVRTDTLALAGGAAPAADDTLPPRPGWARVPAPRWEDFPATERFAGTPAPADLGSRPWAREFRTVLRAGAAAGPNFAGAYTIVLWGCGTQCQRWAVVDARTGRVHGHPFDAELGVDFRRDSRLVAVNPLRPDETPSPWRPAPAYFAWDGREMVRVPLPPPPVR
jgi:hypothetical protein